MQTQRQQETTGAARGADGRVYVLRVWYEAAATGPCWRATLRAGASGERRHFASLDACLEYLYGELGRP